MTPPLEDRPVTQHPETLEEILKERRRDLNLIIDRIAMGLVFINHLEKEPLLANDYFKAIPAGHRSAILDHIFRHIATARVNKQRLNVNQELEINEKGKKYLYGYTTYSLERGIVIVFLSEIASKSILFESRREGQFYDKFSSLVAEIAHEIGNPLTGISTILQVLQHNITVWPQEKVSNYIDRTIGEINRLNKFLNRIRDVSNENKLEFTDVSLRGLIENLYQRNEENLKRAKIKFINEVPEDLDVHIDEGALYQILLNLLNNSLNLLPAKKQVRLYIDSIDDFFITLVYRNNGDPIEEEDLEKIFSPFYTTREEGVGIGLAISLKLMTRMGGTMKAVPPEDG